MLRVFEGFFGYQSQSMALKKFRGDFVSVGGFEIDESAILAACAVHCEGEIDYPSNEHMIGRLIARNIGLNFKTVKTPWEKMKGKALTKTQEKRVKAIFRACILTKNFGDISRINPMQLPDMDLFTYSYPCTDISLAGKQEGFKEGSGTRSSLLWECQKIIELKRPKYLMMENVKNLVGKKHKPDFDRWLEVLKLLGYNNYYKVINAKNCGVPQNRERVFCVSILKEYDNFNFHFYEDFDSGIRLKDILEDQVDEKYYLSDEMVKGFIEKSPQLGYINQDTQASKVISETEHFQTLCAGTHGYANGYVKQNKLDMVGMLDIKGNESIRRVYEPGGVSPALTTMQGGNRQPKIVEACAIRGRNPINPKSREAGLETKQMLEVKEESGISNCLTTVQKDSMVLENELKYVGAVGDKDRVGDGKGLSRNAPSGNRVYDSEGIATTQTSQGGGLGGCTGNYLNKFRIRKLTPTECLKLMAVSDEDIKKMTSIGLANTQLYKMAGNSIVVDCMKFLEQLK